MASGDPLYAASLPNNQSIKESSVGKALPQNATPSETPPLTVMMQQAVAMQQFQFQQALLMQQVMAAQQATLKSAAEMAAARAAEISKQLKASDAEDGKPLEGIKHRSLSRSASRSPSHPRSKSRSRSPARYRHGHARSPIHYRRECRSPSRVRNYYGYRSRGYHRGGRSEYSWNMYRHGRDRDYHYRSSRRSRSRGRRSRTKSRSPRRSRSRSSKKRKRSQSFSRSPRRRSSYTRSPRHYREESIPSRQKREEKKSYQASKRSISREPIRSLSVSRQTMSVTPSRKDARSPKLVNTGEGDSDAERPSHEKETTYVEKISGSPLQINQSDHVDDERIAGSLRKRDYRASPKTQSLMVSGKSLCVSFDDKCNKETTYCEYAADKDNESSMGFDFGDSQKQSNLQKGPVTEEVNLKETDGATVSNLGNISQAEELNPRKPVGAVNALIVEESEYDKVLDDWQDDLKSSSREKRNLAYGSREVEKKVDKESSVSDVNLNSRSLMLSAEAEHTFRERAYVLANEDLDKAIEKDYTEGKEDRRECDDLIFEGPSPAIEDDEGMAERLESGRVDSTAYVVERDLLLRRNEEEMHLIAPDQRKICDIVDSVEDKVSRKVAGSIDREEGNLGDRSYSIDAKQSEDDVAKHDRQRNRHKRHKKKHRHKDLDQNRADGCDGKNEDEDKHRAQKRHRKKHKEGEYGNKERKKRKHKHRTKSKAEESHLADGDEGRYTEDCIVSMEKTAKHKKSKQDVSDAPPQVLPPVGEVHVAMSQGQSLQD